MAPSTAACWKHFQNLEGYIPSTPLAIVVIFLEFFCIDYILSGWVRPMGRYNLQTMGLASEVEGTAVQTRTVHDISTNDKAHEFDDLIDW